jgi:hypothetical protein
MSYQATDCVFENSKSVKTDRTVLLAIASHADPDRFEAWPSLETIALKCGGVSVRTVQRCLTRLVALGELEITKHGAPQHDRKTPWRSNLYRITLSESAETDLVVTGKASSGDKTGGLVVTDHASSHDNECHMNHQLEPSFKPSSEPRHEADEFSELIAHLADKRYEKKLREGGIKNPERASRYKAQVRSSIRSNEMDRVRSLIADNLDTSDLAELADFDVNGRPQVDQRNVGARQPTSRDGSSYSPCRLCMGVDPDKGDCQRCGGTGEQLYYSSEFGYIAYPDVLGGLPVAERYLANRDDYYQSVNDETCYWLSGDPWSDEDYIAAKVTQGPDADVIELAAFRSAATL